MDLGLRLVPVRSDLIRAQASSLNPANSCQLLTLGTATSVAFADTVGTVTSTRAETLDEPAKPPASRSRSKVPLTSRIDFWIDLTLLLAFTLDYSFRFTGLTIHEWIGMGLAPVLLVHVTLHWDWVVRTTRRLVQRRAGRETIRWIVDLVLMLAMTLCVASGILISRKALPTLGFTRPDDGFWKGLHTTTADVTVFLVGLHVALSWRWILSVGRRLMTRRRRNGNAI